MCAEVEHRDQEWRNEAVGGEAVMSMWYEYGDLRKGLGVTSKVVHMD